MSRPRTRWPENGICIRSIHQREHKPSVQLFLWPFGPSISLKCNHWCLVFIIIIIECIINHRWIKLPKTSSTYLWQSHWRKQPRTSSKGLAPKKNADSSSFALLDWLCLGKRERAMYPALFITATSGLSGFAPSAVGTSCIWNYNHKRPKLTLRAERV